MPIVTPKNWTMRNVPGGLAPDQSAARRRFRAGAVLVYATAAMTLMIMLASLAVDYGRVQSAKTELQQAADAAARYGAAGLSQGVSVVQSRVVASGAENKVDGQPLVIDPNNDIEFGTWNSNTGIFTVLTGVAQSSATAIRVTVHRSAARGTAVPTIFATLMGQTTIDIQAAAVAGAGQGADVVLIQDITGSFADELGEAKIGDQAVLDALYANGVGWSRVAVLVHTGWGQTLAPLASVASNYSYLTTTINKIQLCDNPGMPACSGTDIASGFDEAITLYSDPSYVAPAGGKTVVLVSDGQPSADSAGKHPTLDDAELLALAQDRADQLWALGVHVYVVFFDRDNDATAAANLNSLIRGNGEFVRVPDPTQLPAALADLTKRLPIQLVH